MRRRELLMLAAVEQPHAPVDEQRMNEFARAYNEYAARLRDGVLDLKQWAEVVRAWERLR